MNKLNGKTPALALPVLLTTLLSGCQSINSYVPQFIKPHKIEVQQGNVVTPEQIALLRQGMTRDQVRFLLGTPLLSDVFHTNRWDYVFRLKKQDQSIEENRLTLFFDDNSLQRYVTTIPLSPEVWRRG